jgi:hypothetical protein
MKREKREFPLKNPANQKNSFKLASFFGINRRCLDTRFPSRFFVGIGAPFHQTAADRSINVLRRLSMVSKPLRLNSIAVISSPLDPRFALSP